MTLRRYLGPVWALGPDRELALGSGPDRELVSGPGPDRELVSGPGPEWV